jgi:hypothetical protein
MMAVAKYMVITPFTYEGIDYSIGQELNLRDAEGERLVKTGKLQIQKYYNPDNATEKLIIDDVKSAHAEKVNDEKVEEIEQDKAKSDELKQADEEASEEKADDTEEVKGDGEQTENKTVKKSKK